MSLRKVLAESLEVFESLRGLEPRFDAAASLIVDRLRGGGKLLLCGNGGSATDAMHMSTELVCRFETERRHLPAICLNGNVGDLTAFANDFAFEEVFSRGVEAFGKAGDLLVVFSTSGNSPNILSALKRANSLGIASIALLGKGGGACLGLSTVELLVESESTARIQEAHTLLIHGLCSEVDRAFAKG